MRQQQIEKQKSAIWLAGFACLIGFLFDINLELGTAAAVPYVIVIWLAYASNNRDVVIAFAVVCSILTLTGLAVSPVGGEPAKIVANRGISFLVIWATAIPCIRTIKFIELNEFNKQKVDRVEQELHQRHGQDVRKRRALANILEDLRIEQQKLQQALNSTKLAEDRYRNAEATLRAVFDSSRSFIGLATTDGILIDANRTAVAAAGVPLDEVLGIAFWETPWWTHSEKLQNRLKQAFERAAAGHADGFEATHPTPDGQEIFVDFSLSPIFDENRNVINLVPEGRDITDRKKWETELENYLVQLKETNQDLEQFAYVASHDLRSPLRGIAHAASFIREDEGDNLSESSREYLEKMESRITRMQQLLDDLLTYSRIGREQGEQILVNVRQLIEDIVDLLAIPDGFVVDIPDNLPTFQTFVSPLRQVFLNLIGNAIKHHDKDRGSITIEFCEQGAFYEFRVADDGPGISNDFHEKVFEMFKTLKSRDEVEGSGMGLAIILKLVRYYGGDITIESELGEGTTFIFTWPRRIT